MPSRTTFGIRAGLALLTTAALALGTTGCLAGENASAAPAAATLSSGPPPTSACQAGAAAAAAARAILQNASAPAKRKRLSRDTSLGYPAPSDARARQL